MTSWPSFWGKVAFGIKAKVAWQSKRKESKKKAAAKKIKIGVKF